MIPSEPSSSAEKQGQLYWLLSSLCLSAPSLEFLSEIVGPGYSAIEHGPPGALLTEDILDALEKEGGIATFQESASREFVTLFRGLREGFGPPPPYESVYLGSDDPLATMASVTDFYQRAGFSSIPGVDDQPDHIGAELRFLSLLSVAEFEAQGVDRVDDCEHYRQLRLNFINQHALPWIPQCCKVIHDATRQSFYKNLADTITTVISMDYTALKEQAISGLLSENGSNVEMNHPHPH